MVLTSLLVQLHYDFVSFKFIVLPLVLLFAFQLNYDFALGLNLQFCHHFCFSSCQVTTSLIPVRWTAYANNVTNKANIY
ncbi:hypothetical protein Hanom_Chr07g00675981 [Helianthus anomalus]